MLFLDQMKMNMCQIDFLTYNMRSVITPILESKPRLTPCYQIVYLYMSCFDKRTRNRFCQMLL